MMTIDLWLIFSSLFIITSYCNLQWNKKQSYNLQNKLRYITFIHTFTLWCTRGILCVCVCLFVCFCAPEAFYILVVGPIVKATKTTFTGTSTTLPHYNRTTAALGTIFHHLHHDNVTTGHKCYKSWLTGIKQFIGKKCVSSKVLI